MGGRVVIALLLGVILGVPFVLTSGRHAQAPADDAHRLVVVTPHVPQIRAEFGRAFEAWYLREYGEAVSVDWRAPGGTTEIRKQLEAMFQGAVKSLAEQGRLHLSPDDNFALPAGSIEYDLFFGGGSFDHGLVASGVSVVVPSPQGDATGTTVTVKIPMSAPAGFTQDELDGLFGENRIGPQTLYDPKQFWIGTALSSFGIVYNRDVFGRLGVDQPDSFEDLTDPRLIGWVALADPRQSGSITTTFDSILGNQGWERGWRTLRGMCGATRYFTNSSTKPPIDVSMGEAAAGLAIDFYGRGQAQVIGETGGGDRVGYTDPAGSVYVDADPVSLINGATHPELARRFIRFCMTEEGQALWQFRAGDASNPTGPDGLAMGPVEHELRRMPVRRVMYEKYFDAFVDKVNPFEIVSDVQNPGWRTGVQMMMGCFGVDLADECRAAYRAIAKARSSGAFSPAEIEGMEDRFYAFPPTRVDALANLPGFAELGQPAQSMLKDRGWKWRAEVLNGLRHEDVADSEGVGDLWLLATTDHEAPFTQGTYNVVRNEWRQAGREALLRIEYTDFFRRQYRSIVSEVNGR